MHVVHVYGSFDPREGGPPAVVAGLAWGLRAAGHAVTLVSGDLADAPAVDAFLGTHLVPLPPRLSVRPRLPHKLDPAAGPLRALLKTADVLHVHGVWPPAGLLATQVATESGLPWVLTPHGMLHREALHQKRLKKLFGLYALGYRRVISDAAVLHVLNDDERRLAVGPRRPARIVEIPNGIFPDEFVDLPERGASRASVPGLADAPFVLSLARLHLQKGPDLLLEAFASLSERFPGVHLVFAGPDQGAGPGLRAEAERRGLSNRVHLPGPRFGRARLEALVDAAVFCLPSRQEGFSMAITEALAAGLPAVVSDACHFPQVESAGCGRVTSLRPSDLAAGLAEVLDQVLDHPDAARELGMRGQALVAQAYTWPRIGERMVALYTEVRR